MKLTLDFFKIEYHSGIPVYKQIINLVSSAFMNDEIQGGDKLPPIRRLATYLNINPNTVAKAYRELEMVSIVESAGRNGSCIKERLKPEGTISQEIKKSKLDEIFKRAVSEAKAYSISEDELNKRFGKGNENE